MAAGTRRRVHIDIETRSRCELKVETVYRYAKDPSTEVLVVCYAFDHEPGTIWVPRVSLPLSMEAKVLRRVAENRAKLRAEWKGAPLRELEPDYPLPKIIVQPHCPDDLYNEITIYGHADPKLGEGGEVRAHNAAFERNVLSGEPGKKIGVPIICIEQTVCTMAKAASHSMPEGLGACADSLGTYPKDETGVNDMRYLCKPRQNGTFAEPEDEPDRYISLFSYCMDDVYAERGVDDAIPDLSRSEQGYYELDQRINDRGWRVDSKSCALAEKLAAAYREELKNECVAATGYTPGQTGKLAEWCRDEGYLTLPNLQAETVNDSADDPSCPEHVRRVLRVYSTHNMKAVAKYPSILRAKGDDDVLRGMFQFHAAGTGRWSSRIAQLHNLYRPKISDQETAIEAFKQCSLAWMKALYDGQKTPDGKYLVNPMMVLASCVRGMLIARDGRKLIFPDFSGIEARFNAWAWDEDWKLLAYRAYDTIVTDDRGNVVFDKKGEPMRQGQDLYVLAYARAFGISPDDVTKAMRQIGKVMELALGYEGGVGAFVTMTKTYGIDLAELTEAALPTLPQDVLMEALDGWDYAVKMKRTHDLPKKIWVVIDALKRLWRRAHPKIVAGWKALKEAAVEAVRNTGQIYACGGGGKVMFLVKGKWLYMRLPSGRKLAYFKPRIAEDGTIRYMGVDTKTRRWGWTSSYGGKWDENYVQGSCACLLREALKALEEEGYDPVGHVHDEPVVECDEDFGSVEHAGGIICRPRAWAPGLPLSFEGHQGRRYRK